MEFLAYKYDGTPIIIDSEKTYDFEYTETAPPEGIYSPFEFNGTEWIGASREEWEADNPTIVYEPSEIEMAAANLQMQLMKSNITQMQAQKQVASLLLDNQKKDNAIKILQAQHAEMMLEITKLKGGN